MRKNISVSLLVLLLATLSACATLGTETPGVTNVGVSEAKGLLDRSVTFIDLRGKDFVAGHVPGAVHIDWNDFDRDRLSRVVDTDDEVVMYCYGYGCYRSREASALAVAWGYQKVYHFAGGYRAWKNKGYPIE